MEAKAADGSGLRFIYDALGRRVVSFDGRSETIFVWDGLKLPREEYGINQRFP